MRRLIFLAHDPGGYDVIRTVYDRFAVRGCDAELFLSGAAGKKAVEYEKTKEEILNTLQNYVSRQIRFILVTGTSWNSELEVEALRFCNSKGIPTVSMLDYWSNYKERFRLGNGYEFPRHLFVMDQLAFDEAEQNGVPTGIMQIVGQPGLDFYVHRSIRKHGTGSGKLLFLSQPLSDLYGDSEGYTEFDAFEGVLDAGRTLGCEVNIKFHPKENARMTALYSRYRVDGSLEEICGEYRVVIGMTTMGLLQCSLMGVPVLSYQPNLTGTEKCIVNKLGIAKGAYSYLELIEQLKNIEKPDDVFFPFWFDGRSTDRCVEKLIEICEEE